MFQLRTLGKKKHVLHLGKPKSILFGLKYKLHRVAKMVVNVIYMNRNVILFIFKMGEF